MVAINELLCMENAGAEIANKGLGPMAIEKSKSWEPFWSYQLNSTANPAHLPQNWTKLAKSAVLFSW